MEQLMIFEDMAPAKREAAMLHMELQQAVSRAVDSLLEVGRLLKRMRDTEGWKELGFDSFGGYTEAALGIKQRQAYNYITVTERVRPEIAAEQAGAGVTKLALLARLNGEQQSEVVAEVADMTTISTKELEELVKEKQELGEQLSFLREERTRDIKTAREAAETAHNLAMEEAREEMDGRIAEAEDALRRARDDADSVRAELEKMKKKAEKAEKNAGKAAQKAAEAARAEERDAAKRDMESALEEEKKKLADEMARKAAELEAAARKDEEAELAGMRLKSSEEAVKVAVAMKDMQDKLNDALDAVGALREKDAQSAGALAGKVARMLDRLVEAWRQEAGVENG